MSRRHGERRGSGVPSGYVEGWTQVGSRAASADGSWWEPSDRGGCWSWGSVRRGGRRRGAAKFAWCAVLAAWGGRCQPVRIGVLAMRELRRRSLAGGGGRSGHRSLSRGIEGTGVTVRHGFRRSLTGMEFSFQSRTLRDECNPTFRRFFNDVINEAGLSGELACIGNRRERALPRRAGRRGRRLRGPASGSASGPVRGPVRGRRGAADSVRELREEAVGAGEEQGGALGLEVRRFGVAEEV